ncbi:hypothetical protein B566_EDAN007962 [Ephemera danica]|nr:hypothetical protein B566_EDAN007962 [Ephemera danica]
MKVILQSYLTLTEPHVPENNAQNLLEIFFTGTCLELFQRVATNVSTGKNSRDVYSPEIRTFALTLHFHSTAAYNYVRDVMHLALPDVSTLRSWYSEIDADVGFCNEAFDILKCEAQNRLDNGQKPMPVALIIDEMHLKKDITFTGSDFSGLIDLGTGLDPEGLERPLATEALVFMVEKEKLRAGNKLRKRHIQFRKQIMKVNLAVQTLSASVADAIEFCNKDMKLIEFRDSAPTVEFIRTVDRAFDHLNSRNPYGKGIKAPLKQENESHWRSFFQKAMDYLIGLKVQNCTTGTSGYGAREERTERPRANRFAGDALRLLDHGVANATVCQPARRDDDFASLPYHLVPNQAKLNHSSCIKLEASRSRYSIKGHQAREHKAGSHRGQHRKGSSGWLPSRHKIHNVGGRMCDEQLALCCFHKSRINYEREVDFPVLDSVVTTTYTVHLTVFQLQHVANGAILNTPVCFCGLINVTHPLCYSKSVDRGTTSFPPQSRDTLKPKLLELLLAAAADGIQADHTTVVQQHITWDDLTYLAQMRRTGNRGGRAADVTLQLVLRSFHTSSTFVIHIRRTSTRLNATRRYHLHML